MPYQFREASLGPNFCMSVVANIKKLIDDGLSFNIVSMPGVGVTMFLRYLATRSDLAGMVYVDAYDLLHPSKQEFFTRLAKELSGNEKFSSTIPLIDQCKQALAARSKTNNRVVLIFNRFDQLGDAIDHGFIGNLQTLRNVNPERVILITTSKRPLGKLFPHAITGPYIKLFSTTFYFKPYTPADTERLLDVHPAKLLEHKTLDQVVKNAGGHYQLAQLLLRSPMPHTPLSDYYVRVQLKEIYDTCTSAQKQILQRLARGNTPKAVDPWFSNLGIVQETPKGYALFSPLFSTFIKSIIPAKLPAKESRLFAALKRKEGQVVAKDELFDVVWGENAGEASDWALNALIYRLRKNPWFARSDYVIENHKKLGYAMVKE